MKPYDMLELQEDMFSPVGKDEEKMEALLRPSLTYWQDAWLKLKKNKVAMASMCIIGLCCLLALFGPYLGGHDYTRVNADAIDQTPSLKHWFGTDSLGRDLWARLWMGARISLSIGFLATLINSVLGSVVGGISGYLGGKTDMFLMRTVDVLYGIPYIIIAILVMVVLGTGMQSLILAMVVVGWIKTARLVRGQVMQLKNQEFVLAAKKLGAGNLRILFRHLIPNTLGVIITDLTMAVPYAIFTEAFLSYIGLGIQPPQSSWGLLARAGAQCLRTAPYQMFLPAFFIGITMLSLNLFGDGLRDALDPRIR